jgi:hypothetical protein
MMDDDALQVLQVYLAKLDKNSSLAVSISSVWMAHKPTLLCAHRFLKVAADT